MDMVLEEVDVLKQKFQTYGPKFSGSAQVFAEVSAQIVSKAATYLTITSRQEVNINQRKLQERVEYLEERAIQDKKEYQQSKLHHERILAEVENARNDAYKNDKLSEERLKISQDEHAKAILKMKTKNDARVAELENQAHEMQQKLRELETIHKSREDDDFKKNTEFNKLNALIEQKLELTEKELLDYKAKYAAKDADFKEVNKELNRTRKELQTLTNKAHLQEQTHQDEI